MGDSQRICQDRPPLMRVRSPLLEDWALISTEKRPGVYERYRAHFAAEIYADV